MWRVTKKKNCAIVLTLWDKVFGGLESRPILPLDNLDMWAVGGRALEGDGD